MTGLAAGRRTWLSRLRRSDLLQAGTAIAIAGAGRVLLNSVIGFGAGPDGLAHYATAVSAIMLWAGLAAAGPTAAITLGVARRWGETPGELPSGLLWDLLRLLALFVVAAIVGGVMTLSPDHRPFGWLWVLAVIVVAAYQAAKAAGYATRHARIVTLGELAGALIALTGALMLIWWRPPDLNDALVGAYLLGPLAFLLVFTYRMYGRIRVRAMRAVSSERRLAIRASGLFFVGAGSSMALQYLPVIISGHLAASVTTALLFGALQAGGVLLLLTRAYGTVMMPSFAADHNDSRPSRHMVAVRAIFLPSLALGLGFAPWVVLSLGFTPGPRSVTIAALVILLVLMQVWATPAVTVLSSRGREWIPALASLAGLLLASVFWTVAMRTAESFLLPVGLVAGGAVRSLLPLWIFHGCPVRPSRAGGLAAVGGVAASVAILVWAVPRGATMALAGGTALLTVGLLLTARLVVANGMRDADPAR